MARRQEHRDRVVVTGIAVEQERNRPSRPKTLVATAGALAFGRRSAGAPRDEPRPRPD
jgi:hypothetical protein